MKTQYLGKWSYATTTYCGIDTVCVVANSGSKGLLCLSYLFHTLKVLMSNPDTLLQSDKLVSNWKDSSPILRIVDATRSPIFLSILTAGEVDEAQEQHELEGTSAYNSLEHFKEIIDIFVFFFSLCHAQEIVLDLAGIYAKANGQGKESTVYDQLKEKALNLSEGNLEKNAHDFLILLVSLTHHLPQYLDIVYIMNKVIEKNSKNRPQQYYQPFDEKTGRPLTLDELHAKYQHVEKMLRILRNHLGSPLERWAHEPFADLINDYENSETNQLQLLSMLATFKPPTSKIVFSNS